MPYCKIGNLDQYYEETGQGEPIITNHGVREDTSYWRVGGVTAALAEKYRVISMDMRCHGQSILNSEPWCIDVDTMVEDIDRLADHLKLDKFHLLSHATGGMVAAHYGMKHSDRLLSLMLTDTGSATRPFKEGSEIGTRFLQHAAKNLEWAQSHPNPTEDDLKAQWIANPDVWTFTIAARAEPERTRMRIMMAGFEKNRLKANTDRLNTVFFPSFYTDEDPRVEELRCIKCPTLIMLGEYDIVFLGPSEIMAKEIPNNRHVILKSVGHMTAIEAPDETARELLKFLADVRAGNSFARKAPKKTRK